MTRLRLPRLRRRSRVLLFAAAVPAVLVGGCATPQPLTPTVSGDYSELPLSGGAEILLPTGEVPDEPPTPESCGALASLRPATAPVAPGAGQRAGRDHRPRPARRRHRSEHQPLQLPGSDHRHADGVDVDVAREMARDLFGDPSKVEFRLLTFGDRFEALENGDVDLVVKGTSITCARTERVAFSTVYFQAYQRLLVPKGSTSPVRRIWRAHVLHRRRHHVPRHRATRSARGHVVAVPDWDDCLVALQQGQADAASTDDSILAGLAAQDPNLEIVGPPLESEPYGIGVNKNHDDLVRFVNGTLDRMRADGTWTRLYDNWLTVLGPTAGPPPPTYRD